MGPSVREQLTSMPSRAAAKNAAFANARGGPAQRRRFHPCHGVAKLGAFGAIVAVLSVSAAFALLPEALAVLAVAALAVVVPRHLRGRAKVPKPELSPSRPRRFFQLEVANDGRCWHAHPAEEPGRHAHDFGEHLHTHTRDGLPIWWRPPDSEGGEGATLWREPRGT